MSCKKFNCIYSLGFKCGTELELKSQNLISFSSIFGSCYIGTIDNLIQILNSRFDILFNPKNLIPTKNIEKYKDLNKEHGDRTLNKIFDNIDDWHSAMIAHHDMSSEKVKDHFERAISRFYKLINNNIPTLFVYTGPNIVFEKCQELVKIFTKEGYTQFHILFLNFVNPDERESIKKYEDEYITIYDVNHESKLQKILKNYDLSSLITIEEIDTKRLFIK